MGDTSQCVEIGAVSLKNPIMAASGTFGYGTEFQSFFDVAQLGAVCTKGLSLAPRVGNRSPRVCETPSGMLNAIGLANIGVEAFCSERLPLLRERGVVVIANLYATSVDEFATLAARLEDEQGITALEVNISCPNVSEGGIAFGKSPQMAAAVTASIRSVTKRPLWVKLSPEACSLQDVAMACEEAGADALVAINTIRALSIDINTWRPRLANGVGGLSGPAIHPIAVRMVWELSRCTRLPIIGVGGVESAQDAIEFMLAGASAVQVGCANFRDPLATVRIVEGIRDYCAERTIDAKALVGRAEL